MIYAPYRNADPTEATIYIQNAVKLVNTYPDFILGFDVVGQEDLGRPLVDFLPEILNALKLNPSLKVFFPCWGDELARKYI